MGKYQEPQYESIEKDGAFELRRYTPFLSVATRDETLKGQGFRRLFSYISGRNKAEEKMPMTIPVLNDPSDDTMAFVLPLHMVKKGDAPAPIEDQEFIKEYQLNVCAVVRFSGRSSEAKITMQTTMLEAWCEARGYTPTQAPLIARYNAPMTPGFLRRNEIILPVEEINET